MRLGDGEILVVPLIWDHRKTPLQDPPGRSPRQVEALLRRVSAERLRPPHPEVYVVAVELRRLGILRAGSVQRVEVEARRASLHQLGRRDALAEHDLRLVERQVVIDELADVGVAGRDAGGAPRARGHRVRETLQRPHGELFPLRPEPGEAERRRRSLDGGRKRTPAPADALGEEPLTEDEVTLRAVMLHGGADNSTAPDMCQSPGGASPSRSCATACSKTCSGCAPRTSRRRSRTKAGMAWMPSRLASCVDTATRSE